MAWYPYDPIIAVNAVFWTVFCLFFILGLFWGNSERKKREARRAILQRPYSLGTRGGKHAVGLLDNITTARICVPTVFFPCVMAGFNRAEVDNRECTACDAILVSNPYSTRQSLRTVYEMPRDEIYDCIVSIFCICCVICQDATEIETRGTVGMSRGGHGGTYGAVPVENEVPAVVPSGHQAAEYLPETKV